VSLACHECAGSKAECVRAEKARAELETKCGMLVTQCAEFERKWKVAQFELEGFRARDFH
jgi:hypothetical protein